MGLLTEGSSRPVDMVGLIPVAEAGQQDRKDKMEACLLISLDIIQMAKFEKSGYHCLAL